MNDSTSPGGGYVAYRDLLLPKQGAGTARHYWQGPGTKCWGGGPGYLASAPQFPDQHAARAAVDSDRNPLAFSMSDVGYEWRPTPAVQQDLPDAVAAPSPSDGEGR